MTAKVFYPRQVLLSLLGAVFGACYVAASDAMTRKATMLSGANPCAGQKEAKTSTFKNKACEINGVINTVEQAGANVTKGYNGSLVSKSTGPITDPYWKAGLCPVNVHWHLGAEHFSAGQYDNDGTGPAEASGRKLLAAAGSSVRRGFRCKMYNANTPKFTKPYDWKHCVGMVVGETYEVHWPHSAAGACGTVDQFQTPFYDGVFCKDDFAPTNKKIGVQSQVFTIVNDENYYYPNLMRGMIVDADRGQDLAMYTGSTTGTTRSNTICSAYAPITWQVDRKCHLISASSFDKMCADMKANRDDMSEDLYAHGSRELVADKYAANNHAN